MTHAPPQPTAARREIPADVETDLYDLLRTPRMNQVDQAFYRSLAAERGGPVLELACGTGRVLLACAGLVDTMAGVDLSPSMLARARANAAAAGIAESRLRLEVADIRTVRLKSAFPLVVMGGQPICFMPGDGDLRALLGTVRAHLAPGGWWAAGVPVPRAESMARAEGQTRFVAEVRHPETGRRLAVWDYTSSDGVAQVATRRRVIEALDEDGYVLERRHLVQHLHYRHPAELRRSIEEAGFRFEALYGGYDRSPLGPGSDYMVWIAAAA